MAVEPFRAHATIPGIEKEAARSLTHQLKRIEANLDQLSQPQGITPVITADLMARIGQLIRIAIPAAGLKILLPQATDSNHGGIVSFAVEAVAPGGVLTISVEGGQQRINGAATVTVSSIGLFETKAIHEGGWVMATGGQSLAAVLAIGNETGGTELVISTGDYIQIGDVPTVDPTGITADIRSSQSLFLWSDVSLTFSTPGSLFFTADMFQATGGTSMTFNCSGVIDFIASFSNVNVQTATNGFFSINAYQRFTERSSGAAPALSSGQALLWARSNPYGTTALPNGPAYKDESNAVWDIGYGAPAAISAITTITAAVTNISCGSFAVPANTARVRTVYEPWGYFVYQMTLVGAPTLTLEVLIGGVVVDACVFTPAAAAAIWAGELHASLTVLTIGAGGTVMVNCRFDPEATMQAAGTIASSVAIAAVAFDTTIANTIEMRVRMTVAVALNALTVTQGYMKRPR